MATKAIFEQLHWCLITVFTVPSFWVSVVFSLLVQEVKDTPAQCKFRALNLDDEEKERESIKENNSKSTAEVLHLLLNKLSVTVELQNSTRPSYRCTVFGNVMQRWQHVMDSFYQLVCRTFLSFSYPALVLSHCKSLQAGCCRVCLFVCWAALCFYSFCSL